jgi:threonine synthase
MGLIKDRPFADRYRLTSADTINPGRLLPQAFYYFYAFIKLKKLLSGNLMFSVPSGNFGNFMSGLYAWKFGMPVNGFIAAMNNNNAFENFFKGSKLTAKPHVSTCSPAMDITRPSNYERLLSFYEEAPAVMKNMVYPAAIDDETTRASIKFSWEKYKLLLDPHSAVALAAARKLSAQTKDHCDHTVILATGHPAREADTVKLATGQSVPIPEKFRELGRESSPIALIDPQLLALESAIASCF